MGRRQNNELVKKETNVNTKIMNTVDEKILVEWITPNTSSHSLPFRFLVVLTRVGYFILHYFFNSTRLCFN